MLRSTRALLSVVRQSRPLTTSVRITEHPARLVRSNYTRITPTHVAKLREIVGRTAGVIDEPSDVLPFTTDWMNKYKAPGSIVVRPTTTAEVAAVLKFCNDNNIAVVPQGGNTGLVGGSTPVFDEIVLSLSALNKVRSVDSDSGVIVCDAGCVLQNLESLAQEIGFNVPLDLGAKGSCQIGGNVSTLAGGLRLYRYGNLRNHVLGLEVVLADGTIINNLNTLRKDVTGYDVKQLFMGSEGSLGVVTGVAIALVPKPNSIKTVLLGTTSFDKLLRAQSLAKESLNEIVSALEFFDAVCLRLVVEKLGHKCPLPGQHEFHFLLETRGSNAAHDEEKLLQFMDKALKLGVVEDGIFCETEAQAQAVWKVRESISEAFVKRGAIYKYDLSLPHKHMYQLVEETNKRFQAANVDAIAGGFGHLGDCETSPTKRKTKRDKTQSLLLSEVLLH
eukprot:c12949_g1_i1.p1 GENE.c12949_g1_i1~~c12949_g1_i1.p1  ORF type:complete len:446 (+),score=104.00 c12949_g1_i1:25-1362(+)